MQLHLQANFFGKKLIRFGQIWLDFGEQIWLDFGEILAKFGQM